MTLFQSINKESIIDLHAKIVTVPTKIESCTEQNLELTALEIYLVSSAKPQLPLQIEDASRPEKNNVILFLHSIFSLCQFYFSIEILQFKKKSCIKKLDYFFRIQIVFKFV